MNRLPCLAGIAGHPARDLKPTDFKPVFVELVMRMAGWHDRPGPRLFIAGLRLDTGCDASRREGGEVARQPLEMAADLGGVVGI